MGTATMGQVRVRARIENLRDVLNVRAGKVSATEVRSVEGGDALVDTDAKIRRAAIGVLALEALDFLVDPVNQSLIGNPEHGGENMLDMF